MSNRHVRLTENAKTVGHLLVDAWNKGVLPQRSGLTISRSLNGKLNTFGGKELLRAMQGIATQDLLNAFYELAHKGLILLEVAENSYTIQLLEELRISERVEFSD